MAAGWPSLSVAMLLRPNFSPPHCGIWFADRMEEITVATNEEHFSWMWGIVADFSSLSCSTFARTQLPFCWVCLQLPSEPSHCLSVLFRPRSAVVQITEVQAVVPCYWAPMRSHADALVWYWASSRAEVLVCWLATSASATTLPSFGLTLFVVVPTPQL